MSGEVLQDSTTANLIFGVDDVIAYVSQTMTLEPGDLILTGTPAGVGVFRDPQRLLQPGDEVTIEIEGLDVDHEPGRRRLKHEARFASLSAMDYVNLGQPGCASRASASG